MKEKSLTSLRIVGHGASLYYISPHLVRDSAAVITLMLCNANLSELLLHQHTQERSGRTVS